MTHAILTQDYLQSILEYNPDTGVFTWRVRRGRNCPAGKVAGRIATGGYRQIGINGRLYLAHRIAWLITHGRWPADQIDHINRVRDDNRLINLREATRTENQRNQSLYKNNTSGLCGVGWYKPTGKWMAHISIDGKLKNLGYFDNLFDAGCARKSAEIEYSFHPNHGSK